MNAALRTAIGVVAGSALEQAIDAARADADGQVGYARVIVGGSNRTLKIGATTRGVDGNGVRVEIIDRGVVT